MDSCEPAWSRSAREVHEHGLELIVGVVSGRDVGDVVFIGDACQRVVSSCAGVVLGVALVVIDVDGLLDELASQSLCDGRDRVSIACGQVIGSEIVDDVGDEWLGSDQCEDRSEGGGIWTSGACDEC